MYDPELYCDICERERVFRRVTIRGAMSSEGAQIDPDEDEYFCTECGGRARDD